jgi:hypothetical protein
MSVFEVARKPGLEVGPVASEAVIAEARRRQRRRRLVLVALALALAVSYALYGHPGVGSGGGAGTASQISSPSRVAGCLQRNSILVSRVSSGSDFRFAPALRVSFALVPGQRLDAAYLFFEHSPSEARSVVATLVRRFEAKAPVVRSYFTQGDGVVVLWDAPHPSAASQATVQGCL